jgi:hypothetical protein
LGKGRLEVVSQATYLNVRPAIAIEIGGCRGEAIQRVMTWEMPAFSATLVMVVSRWLWKRRFQPPGALGKTPLYGHILQVAMAVVFAEAPGCAGGRILKATAGELHAVDRAAVAVIPLP